MVERSCSLGFQKQNGTAKASKRRAGLQYESEKDTRAGVAPFACPKHRQGKRIYKR